MGRAPCCDKNNVKRGPWAPEEDAKLKDYIDKYGTGGNWIALPQKIGLKRCGKSCRLRWLNYLRPNIKHGGFTEEEDNIICSLYISIGSRWSIIAAQLPGRTDNDIKNYWNTRLKKKLLGRRKQAQNSRLSVSSDQDPKYPDAVEEPLSNSAIERLQLHMQLQTLQNPFSFYSNPSIWPKLRPLQEKMIQNLHSMNQNSISPLMHQFPTSPQSRYEQKADFYESSTNHQPEYSKIDELENLRNGISSSESLNELYNLTNGQDVTVQLNDNVQPASTFTQAEVDELIMNNKDVGFQQEDPMGEFDCFKEMDGCKDNIIWWSNEFHGNNSASSSSWHSPPVLHQSEGIFQDYEIGYNMQ